jgi:hypothetical protein
MRTHIHIYRVYLEWSFPFHVFLVDDEDHPPRLSMWTTHIRIYTHTFIRIFFPFNVFVADVEDHTRSLCVLLRYIRAEFAIITVHEHGVFPVFGNQCLECRMIPSYPFLSFSVCIYLCTSVAQLGDHCLECRVIPSSPFSVLSLSVCVYIYLCMHVRVYVCMRSCMYAHTCVCVCQGGMYRYVTWCMYVCH